MLSGVVLMVWAAGYDSRRNSFTELQPFFERVHRFRCTRFLLLPLTREVCQKNTEDCVCRLAHTCEEVAQKVCSHLRGLTLCRCRTTGWWEFDFAFRDVVPSFPFTSLIRVEQREGAAVVRLGLLLYLFTDTP